MRRTLTISFAGRAALTSCAIFATACVTDEPVGGPLVAEVAAPTAVSALQAVARGASRCWTDGDLAAYSAIPELDTTAGKPRILLVEKGRGGGLPALVIEGEGDPTRIRTYGPLSRSPVSNRINADIIRWSTGGRGCR